MSAEFWEGCKYVSKDPETVSGQPAVGKTRVFADSLPENYEAFRDEGIDDDAAFNETLRCFPRVGAQALRGVLDFYFAHQPQPQP